MYVTILLLDLCLNKQILKSMKPVTRIVCIFLASAILFASCSSTTLIQSNPPKAKVYMEGMYMGETPFYHTDTRTVGSSFNLKIEKDGFKPLNTSISRTEEIDVGAVIGGVFLLIPFLWTMKYKDVHNYDLVPIDATAGNSVPATAITPVNKTKVDRLRDLKQLLDDKIITQDEFEKEKAKILEKD